MSVAILLGSKSDFEVAKKAGAVLKELGIKYTITVASAHRNPERVAELARRPEIDVFIGIAGMSAALPGTIAAHTTKPVIGVPVSGKVNLDSVLAVSQMPPGIPVAAVAIDGGENAAVLAGEMIALKDSKVAKAVEAYRQKIREKNIADAKDVEASEGASWK
ncbi:MAG: 5-(carboxyamino)imidazole ribonucleotide mutase [Euryarchaeota archaeon]|nr:5-(carboxyamino)imidazole ribonucleotide mutase [Euryarchaeota archaeon]